MATKIHTSPFVSLACGANHPEARKCSRCNGTGNTGHVVVHCGAAGRCYKCDGYGYLGGPAVEAMRLPKAEMMFAADVANAERAYDGAVLRLVCTVLGVRLPGHLPALACDERTASLNHDALAECRTRHEAIKSRIAQVGAMLATTATR